jgi:GTP diphosphokinase / guanosine-3',5'-bis(diphosphate) 3'-diphosphatase
MIDRIIEQQVGQQLDISHEAAQLLSLVRQYMLPHEVQRVTRALQLAQDVCQAVVGERFIPPFEHALAVATIMAQMHSDAVGIGAGLVFEAVDADLLSLDRVEQVLGKPTGRVVESMARLNILERKKQQVAPKKSLEDQEETTATGTAESKKRRIRETMRRQQAETVRKMFIGMAEDHRVVLLKLAYRLHAMRLICNAFYPLDRQETLTMAQETREIYAPLAGRLGMSRIESELEDLAFQVLEPETYEWVKQLVEMESKQWRSYVERVCALLQEELEAIGLYAEISGRVKHLYSFYEKLKRNAGNVEKLEDLKAAADVSQIHDLIALRILVESTPDCYVALGQVHSLWKPKEGRIKDFIANPKLNGYQALHTTVFCEDNQLVEVQIRTYQMHAMAEFGVAMHWHYKDSGDNASASSKELLTWLRQLAEWQRELRAADASDTEFMEAVKGDIFQEQIFVFTPKGEVKDLPVGSTPLDFAYRIHTKVGDTCAGARIVTEVGSGSADRLVTRMVPLDYELRSGDIVDIVTSRTAHPTRDWLSIARTANAKSKIRRYLKTHERHINVQIGRERLDRELRTLGPRDLQAASEDAEQWLCQEYRLESFEDLLAAIGADDVRPHGVAVKLYEYWQQRDGKEVKESKEEEEPLVLPTTTTKAKTAHLEVAGVSGLLTKLANCCCPLPGDEILGFISRGKGVIVHRADCQNVKRYQKRERERLIDVNWLSMSQPRYMAPLIVTARDRPGLIRDIAALIADAGINMTSVSSYASRHRETVLINVVVEVDSLDQLTRLFTRLERIKNVLHVERDLGKSKN